MIPAVRMRSPEDALFAVNAIAQGGIPIAEITLTVPGSHKTHLARHFTKRKSPTWSSGAGGVMDEAAARQSLDAGAQFLTSDGLHREVVEFAQLHELVVFSGRPDVLPKLSPRGKDAAISSRSSHALSLGARPTFDLFTGCFPIFH